MTFWISNYKKHLRQTAVPLLALYVFAVGVSSAHAADTSYEFRVGEAASRYAGWAATMDHLKDSICGKPIERRMHLKGAADEILRTAPKRFEAELRQHLSEPGMAALRREAKDSLDALISQALAAKGQREACATVVAGIKSPYFKAKYDWANVIQMK